MRYPGGYRPAIHSYKRKTIQPNDFKVIAALRIRGADRDFLPIMQKEIAAMTGLKQSKISVTLDRLVYKGIVSRFRYSYKADALKLLIYYQTWDNYIRQHIYSDMP